MAVLAPLGAAACGGKTSSFPTSVTTSTIAQPDDVQAWIDAATQGVKLEDGMTPVTARCYARALVEIVGVDRLKAGGATLGLLRDPNNDLPHALGPLVPPATRVALGRAIQRCGFGRLLGPAISESVTEGLANGSTYKPTSTETGCVADALDAPENARIVGDDIVDGGSSTSADRVVAGIFLRCIDFAQLVFGGKGVVLSDAERTCVNDRARADRTLLDAIVARMNGADSSTSNEALTRLGIGIVTCLTPAHIAQLGRR